MRLLLSLPLLLTISACALQGKKKKQKRKEEEEKKKRKKKEKKKVCVGGGGGGSLQRMQQKLQKFDPKALLNKISHRAMKYLA